jgi:hypothetical protein
LENEHNLVWVDEADNKAEKPTFREVVFTGAFNEALDHVIGLAKGAKFMCGQVLSKDGKVLATVAPQGSSHISRD